MAVAGGIVKQVETEVDKVAAARPTVAFVQCFLFSFCPGRPVRRAGYRGVKAREWPFVRQVRGDEVPSDSEDFSDEARPRRIEPPCLLCSPDALSCSSTGR